MDQMYSRTLGKAFEGEDDMEGWCANLHAVMNVIVTVRVPLGMEALADMVGMDVETVAETLSKIASLLYIADNQIRVIHKSLADFLLDPKRCTDSRFSINRDESNQHVVLACLKALNDHLAPNMCGIHPSQFNSEVADLNERIQEKIPGCVQYASRYWIDHLLDASYAREFNQHLDRMFAERVMDWLEVVSVLGIVPVITLELGRLKDWVKPRYAKMNFKTVELINDTF
ncbi:hypothetical protein HK097_004923, partial [Rhizophlyctis rosea]